MSFLLDVIGTTLEVTCFWLSGVSCYLLAASVTQHFGIQTRTSPLLARAFIIRIPQPLSLSGPQGLGGKRGETYI